jgi:hypothetical protein
MMDIDEAKVERNPFGLWLGWTLATAAGMLLGFLPPVLLVEGMELWLARILVPLWAGFLVGLFQWLVLRRYLTHTAGWIVHGGAGWAIGYAAGLLLVQALSGSVAGALLGYLLFGAIVAAAQWPILRKEIPNIAPWVAAGAVGWALGSILSRVVLDSLVTAGTIRQALSTAVIAAVTGLVAGAVTAVALVHIVRQPDRPAR